MNNCFSHLFSSWNPYHLCGVEITLNQLVEKPLGANEKLMQGTNRKIYRVQVPSETNHSSIWRLIHRVQHFIQSYLNTGDHLSAISELMEKLEQEVQNKQIQNDPEFQITMKKFSVLESLTQHPQFQNTTVAETVSRKVGDLKTEINGKFSEAKKAEQEFQQAQQELEKIRQLESERQHLIAVLPSEHKIFKQEAENILRQLIVSNQSNLQKFNGLAIARHAEKIKVFIRDVKEDLSQMHSLYQRQEQLAKDYQKIGEIMKGAIDKSTLNMALSKLNTQLSVVTASTRLELEKIELENLQQQVYSLQNIFKPRAFFSNRDRTQAATL